jgi:hypothetical protein
MVLYIVILQYYIVLMNTIMHNPPLPTVKQTEHKLLLNIKSYTSQRTRIKTS